MSSGIDFLASLSLAALGSVALVAHWLAGRPQFPRVAQQGGSALLPTGPMNTGYWLLQPAIAGLAKAGTSPAILSWLSLVPAITAAGCAAFGHWGLVAWFLLASALLDVLDGGVARQTNQATLAGAILDSTLDRYAEFFLFAGLSYFYRGQERIQLLILAALLGSFLVTYSTAKAEALRLTPPRGFMKRSDRMALLVVGATLSPLLGHWLSPHQALRAWPMFLAAALIAVFANLSAIARLTALARQTRP